MMSACSVTRLLLLAVLLGTCLVSAQWHPPWLICAHARAWLQRGVQPLPLAARRMAGKEANAWEPAKARLPVLARPGLGIVKFGAGQLVEFRALRKHIVRATAQMARAREAGEAAADDPALYSVWRWAEGGEDFVGSTFWALKRAFHAYAADSIDGIGLAPTLNAPMRATRRRVFFARAWANCLGQGEALGWHWHAEPTDDAITVSATLVVAAPPGDDDAGTEVHAGNGRTATLFQRPPGTPISDDADDHADAKQNASSAAIVRCENRDGDLVLFRGTLWHRTEPPSASQLRRLVNASRASDGSAGKGEARCRMTLAFDITDQPRPAHHFVPLLDTYDPWFQISPNAWSSNVG